MLRQKYAILNLFTNISFVMNIFHKWNNWLFSLYEPSRCAAKHIATLNIDLITLQCKLNYLLLSNNIFIRTITKTELFYNVKTLEHVKSL